MLGAGAELGTNGNQSDLVLALQRGSQESINQSGQQLVRRQIDVQPTLTIRLGFPKYTLTRPVLIGSVKVSHHFRTKKACLKTTHIDLAP